MQPVQFLYQTKETGPQRGSSGHLPTTTPMRKGCLWLKDPPAPESKDFFMTQSTVTNSFILAGNMATAVLNLGKQYFSHGTETTHLKRFLNLVISPHPEYTAQLKHNSSHFEVLPFRVTSGKKEEEKLDVVTAKPLFNKRKRKRS